MKRSKIFKYKYPILLVVIMTSFFTVHIVRAVTAVSPEPGSDGDPVVSQSYVDHKISEIGAKLETANTTISDLTKKLTEAGEKINKLTAANETINKQLKEIQPDSFKFQPLELKAGQKLLAGASTEIVLRSGSAKAISGTYGGLSDITAAQSADLTTGAPIALNHLLLASRDDGRGITAVKGCWLIVKGTYKIADK
ncbi:hypothetical protein [Pseudobacteroides cellulosolvens]|uniref:Uncharacterized protein n=1 Tax=Pseudobacteroides cellulosolvens ATCC 35603 = DSM 2933 TaxID=398512 RepID=A0A0L6JNW2_9FIRM|nr:hypothetical protein [Pseudobacteroides cellulosolvens]KNY27390.1 hypothetical protein Bccel_2661 [Pseudobacteroides cellulosolvens ATCC 35603 = DSM 2933]